MAEMRVDTEMVVDTAKSFEGLNNRIRDKFSDVENGVNNLKNFWSSPSSGQSFAKFTDIKNNYCDARYSAVRSYISFLLQQVGQGYEATEDANKSLADAFK